MLRDYELIHNECDGKLSSDTAKYTKQGVMRNWMIFCVKIDTTLYSIVT